MYTAWWEGGGGRLLVEYNESLPSAFGGIRRPPALIHAFKWGRRTAGRWHNRVGSLGVENDLLLLRPHLPRVLIVNCVLGEPSAGTERGGVPQMERTGWMNGSGEGAGSRCRSGTKQLFRSAAVWHVWRLAYTCTAACAHAGESRRSTWVHGRQSVAPPS